MVQWGRCLCFFRVNALFLSGFSLTWFLFLLLFFLFFFCNTVAFLQQEEPRAHRTLPAINDPSQWSYQGSQGYQQGFQGSPMSVERRSSPGHSMDRGRRQEEGRGELGEEAGRGGRGWVGWGGRDHRYPNHSRTLAVDSARQCSPRVNLCNEGPKGWLRRFVARLAPLSPPILPLVIYNTVL